MGAAPRPTTPWCSTTTACSIRKACAYADEFVRHKALDAIGDLALAGAPLLGAYKSFKGGHRINHAVLAALFNDPTAWTVVEAKAEVRAPRTRGHADLTAVSSPPAYRADLS